MQAFEFIQREGAIATEESYPTTGVPGVCHLNSGALWTPGARVTGYQYIADGDAKALREAIHTIGPISIHIQGTSFIFQHYKSGIIQDTDCSSDHLDHAVLAVGYNLDREAAVDEVDILPTTKRNERFWTIKNSFGELWGFQGHGRIVMDEKNSCGVTSAALYPIISA